MEKRNEKEITLGALLAVLKKSFVFMIVAAIVLASLAAVITAVFVKPTYRATAVFWVNSSSTNYDYTSSAQTAAAISIATSLVDLVDEDMPVREAVREGNLTSRFGYENENQCVYAVRRMISSGKTDEGTCIFYVTITGDDSQEVYEVLSSLQSVLPRVVSQLIKLKDNQDNTPLLTVTTPINDVSGVVSVSPSPLKVFLIVAVVVAILVYIIFLIISMFDTVIYDEEDLKDNFTLPVVGVIPSWQNSNTVKDKKKKKRGNKHGIDMSERDYSERLLSEKTPFAVAEAFNQLRTNLVFSAGNTLGNIISVTSAVSGVGKSLMSTNLSLSLSALKKRVLLVECDMRCPSFGRIFGKKNERGLSELLAGIVEDYTEVVSNEADGKIDVIFSGKIPPNPSELLSNDRMGELVSKWKSKYDVVVFDMPPICEVADAGVVSRLVSGYLIAVRCDYSDINEVKRATNAISAVDGKIYGFVLNDFNPKNSGKYARAYYNPEEKYKLAKNDSL